MLSYWLGSILYFFLLIASSTTASYAQGPPGAKFRNQKQNETQAPDSTILKYFTLEDREHKKAVTDTFFRDFEKYLRNRSFKDGVLNLGTLASSAQKIIYGPREDIYTDIGYHQFDIYRISPDDIPYYDLNRPYNDLFFSPLGGGSGNFLVKAKFARNFNDNVNLSVEYERTSLTGAYQNQFNKATTLGIGLWRKSPKKNHSFYLSFLANNFNETNNGGIQNTVDIYSEYNNRTIRRAIRSEIPINLSTTPGMTRHQNFSYSLDNFFTVKEKFKIHHRISFDNGYYRYGDDGTTTSEDSLVYKSYLVDPRGIRVVNKFSRWTNVADIGFDTKSFDLTVGIKYRYLNYDNSIDIRNIHDLNLTGRLKFNVKNIAEANSSLDLGIGSNAGNIQLDNRVKFNLFSDITLNGQLSILRYDPTLIQEELVISATALYQNDFGKVNELILRGELSWDKIDLDLSFKSGVIDNPVAYNTDALPYQLDGSTEYVQGTLEHSFRWKFIGIENSVVYQSFSDNIYRLPRVYSIHNAYVQTTLFKKRLDAQVGIILYNYDYDGQLRFMPAAGVFYPDDTTPIRKFYYTELYGNFKVDRFRIFFKMENFTDRLFLEPHFQIVGYPQYDYAFRMGVRWQFYD